MCKARCGLFGVLGSKGFLADEGEESESAVFFFLATSESTVKI